MSDAEHDPAAGTGQPPARHDRPVRPGIFFYLVLLAVTGGVAASLASVMSARQARLSAQEGAIAREADAGLPVRVAKPKMSGESFDLLLPGDLRADLESPIYAKISGYLKKLTVDKG